MDINWSNITELVIATAFGGAIVWLFTNSATPFFKRHKVRIFRFPSPPREKYDKKWYGFYIRNISGAKANNVEIFINEKLERIEFEPKILHEIKDVDEKAQVIRINSLPAKSEYVMWLKSEWYPGELNATSDGATIEDDLALHVLKNWREWHSPFVFFVSLFAIWAALLMAIDDIAGSEKSISPVELQSQPEPTNSDPKNP